MPGKCTPTTKRTNRTALSFKPNSLPSMHIAHCFYAARVEAWGRHCCPARLRRRGEGPVRLCLRWRSCTAAGVATWVVGGNHSHPAGGRRLVAHGVRRDGGPCWVADAKQQRRRTWSERFCGGRSASSSRGCRGRRRRPSLRLDR